MIPRAWSCTVSCAVVIALASPAPAATPGVRYTVSLADATRSAGSADVQVDIDHAPASLALHFLPWLPGAYELRSFGREVRGVTALDGAGKPLRVRREGVGDFTVTGHPAASSVRVRYRIAASLLSDDGADLSAEHAYFNPGALLPQVAELTEQPHALRIVDLPPGWQVHSALTTGERTWSAPSYEQLCDAPVEAAAASRVTPLHRNIAGARFDVIVDEEGGSAPQLPPQALDDLSRIVEAERALAGPLPFARYLVLVHLSDRGGRNVALEHAASASLVLSGDLATSEGYAALLHMLAHEVFHAWNARRLVPRAAASQPLQTSAALWITEGLTEHVAVVAQRRAGILSATALEEVLSEALTRAHLAERAELSLSDLSLLAGSPPTVLATDPDGYYAVGHAVSLALVAELLSRSQGRVGLAQLLAALLPPAAGSPRTIDVAELARVADSLVPGTTPALSSVLETWVNAPFSLQRLLPSLQRAGLTVRIEASRGADTSALIDGDAPMLRALPPGGAWHRAGARAGDRVLTVGGLAATPASIAQLATGHAVVGKPIAVELERLGARLHLSLLPRARPAIVAVDGTARGNAVARKRLLGGD